MKIIRKLFHENKFYTFLNIIRYIFFIIGVIYFFYSYYLSDLNQSVISILVILFSCVLYGVIDFQSRMAYLLFLASFFLFLLGRMSAEYINYQSIAFYFSLDISKHMLLSIMLSLCFLQAGYEFFMCYINKRRTHNLQINKVSQDHIFLDDLRKISLILFFISCVIAIIMNIEQIIYVKENSYISLFKDFTSQIPRLLQVIGNMHIVSLFVYLGTCPEKKKCVIPCALFGVVAITAMLIGDRGTFIIDLAILLVYIFWREIQDKSIWINRKIIFIFLILSPLCLAFLNFYVSIREDVDMGKADVSTQFTNFFISTGTSVDILGYGKLYENEFPQSFYSFGELVDYPKYNPISKRLFKIEEPKQHTKEYALTMHSFAHTISYFIDRDSYLSGHGKGSSYIAEVYNDFGYIGISICNVIYGFILASINLIKKGKPFQLACILIAIRIMFYVPRGAMILPLSYILNITTVTALIFLYIIYKKSRIITKLIKNFEVKNN